MKKYISFLAAAIMMVCALTACSVNNAQKTGSDDKLQIVTTIFPEYDWVMNILGDNPANAEVTMLLDKGVDLHSYQPTAEDILKITTCDMFIYVGGESDEWVEDVLEGANNEDMVVINLLEVLGDKVKEEEVVEGMEHDHEHEHEDGDDHEDGDEHEHEDGDEHEHEEGEEEEEGPEYDEHVWLSLKNASFLTDSISASLSSIDAANANTYSKNAEAYKEKLNALDKEYENAVSSASINTVIFGDRFPFRYMTDDYNLSYYAAFVGCSAETEASFETIIFLANKVDELSIDSILTIEGNNHKIAETIRDNTSSKDQQIMIMDSMQSVTEKDVSEGASYLSIMESNLSVLKEALK
ncbi:MAG: metal ABC transporter substrate-binding protein [Lachnospiraceae bacterium]|nr:metal ABC transporter substrate-binding protein [Lachnospiraceae bacterium]